MQQMTGNRRHADCRVLIMLAKGQQHTNLVTVNLTGPAKKVLTENWISGILEGIFDSKVHGITNEEQ